MSKEQCRLCLCTTYNLAGISSSITDDSFEAIIRSVFPFALPTFDIVGGKNADLPVLVCFQCSNTIRHFHYFSEHVKANQEKLRSKSCKNQQILNPLGPISEKWSLDEIIQHLKRESEIDETNSIAENVVEELVSTYSEADSQADSEELDYGMDENSFASESNEEIYEEFTTHTKTPQCVEKGELADTLQTMDKRVDEVARQLGFLIQNVSNSERLSKKRRVERQTSFEFSPVRTEEELDTLNQLLQEAAYSAKLLDWLDINITAYDSENRMHQSIDLIFDRAFFAECGWTGRTVTGIEKIPLKDYIQVVKLIQRIGRTDTEIVTPREVNQFLMRKLRYAKYRINFVRLKSCRKKTYRNFC